ncbi:HPr family phosphocarrier protein [Paucidesulfovibrio longus]|jgi:phosphocarrier protein|uniref:HPr family phosphocarrier protein n=1 Tax=Paucidesulfovibrio longus TaxID=889 RepID=UPI0003B6BAAD|nr:HPr family phosphocarrier protein [Paucidesulfovibrio longus]
MEETAGAVNEENAGGQFLVRRVVVANQLGLHARPAGALAQLAQSFTSDISLECDGQEVDAKSILDLLTLAAAQGTRLDLKARGEDAESALDRIEKLFKERFGEGK